MNCIQCGSKVSTLVRKVGFLRVELHRCHCGVVWQEVRTSFGFDKVRYMEELERLQTRYIAIVPPYIERSIEFLRGHLEGEFNPSVAEQARKAKLRNDIWEQRLLRRLIGEDVF